MESNHNGSRAKTGDDDEILVPNYVCCVVTEGVWVWFAAVLLFVVLMFIATLKVSQHTTFTVRLIRSCPVFSAKFPSDHSELGRQWNT